MNLKNKLRFGIIFLIVASAVVGVVVARLAMSVVSEFETVTKTFSSSLTALGQIQASGLGVVEASLVPEVSDDETSGEEREQFEEREQLLFEGIAQYKDIDHPHESQVEQIDAAATALIQESKKLQELNMVGADPNVLSEQVAALEEAEDSFVNLLDEIIEAEMASLQAAQAALENDATSTIVWGISLLIVVAAITFGYGSLFIRYLLSAVDKITLASEEIGQGELSTRVNIHSQDELGKLAQNFNLMASEIEGKTQALNDSKAQLMQMVKERTEQLEGALKTVEAQNQALKTANSLILLITNEAGAADRRGDTSALLTHLNRIQRELNRFN